MQLTNKLNYPEAYCKAAQKHIYPRTLDRIGVTELIDSPQIHQLYLNKYDELVIDVDDFFSSMLGTAWHKHLEKNVSDKCQAEKKWEWSFNIIKGYGGIDNFGKFGNIVLVGKADITNGGIEDYKLISAWSWVFDKDKYFIEQLNVLNWLKDKCEGKQALYLRLHLFIKDWSAYKAKQSQDYPQQRYFSVDLPIWPLEQTEKFINDRLKLHLDKNYKCTDEDKWRRTESFAVLKEGRKSALRVLDTAQEADQWILNNNWQNEYKNGKITIQERKSECKRCLEWCSVRSVCPFALGLNK